MVGSGNNLKVLKKMGYRTFDKYWNESWDSYSEDWLPIRIKEIVSTCKYIIENYKISDIIEKTQDIVDHNYNNLVSLEYSKILFRNSLNDFMDGIQYDQPSKTDS
jgi:hypothetical protein